MGRTIIICKICKKKKELHAKGECYKCYKKKYKTKKMMCRKCNRYRENHSKGYCNSCYNVLLSLENKNYKISNLLRNRLLKAFKLYLKKGKIKTSKDYGIVYKEIIEKLKPFPANLSKYHIDHIIPLSRFDLTNPEEVQKAFAPENHQWLLASENLSKNNKVETQSKLRIGN